MENLFELFDSLLGLVVSFPTTIYYVLFATDQLTVAGTAALVSSPGTTLVIGFLIWYTANTLELRIKYSLDLPALPSKLFLGRILLAVIVALLIQYCYLVLTYFGTMTAADTLRTIKALSYPISVFMTIYSAIFILYLLFPIGSRSQGLSLQERFDAEFRSVRKKSGTQRIVAVENANFLATIAGLLAYSIALYRILRAYFNMLPQSAFLHTAGLIAVSLVLLLIFLFLVYERFDGLIERLRSERETMPDKNH